MIYLKSQEQEKIMIGLCENNGSINDWLHEIAKIRFLTSAYAKVLIPCIHIYYSTILTIWLTKFLPIILSYSYAGSGGPNRTEFTEYWSFGSVLFGSARWDPEIPNRIFLTIVRHFLRCLDIFLKITGFFKIITIFKKIK